MISHFFQKRVDAIVRVPYYYFSDKHLHEILLNGHGYLWRVSDLYSGNSNPYVGKTYYVKRYWYHIRYLEWVFKKALAEKLSRNINQRWKFTPVPDCKAIPSKPITDWIPPKEKQLAEDIIIFTEWKTKYPKGGRQLPISYIRLAQYYFPEWRPAEDLRPHVDFNSIVDWRQEMVYFQT